MPGDDSSDQHDPDPMRTTSIVLAEFAGLRGEVATRINLQVTIILGNLTVLGVVLGIALSRPENRSILLLLPIVTPCIGLLVIDSFRNLDMLGQYIHRFIRPHLRITSQREIDGVEVFGWERWINEHHVMPWLFLPYQVVLFLEFLGPPIAVLIAAIQYHLHHRLEPVSALQVGLWWAGVVLTGGLIPYALGYGAYAFCNPKGSRKIRSDPSGGDAGGALPRHEAQVDSPAPLSGPDVDYPEPPPDLASDAPKS